MLYRSDCSRKALLIIVTFNSYDWIAEIANSIRQFLEDNPDNYAVIVENSHDMRISDYIAANVRSANCCIQVATSNDGFSNGVNHGYRLARSAWGVFDYIVLLNPDVVAGGGTACELVNRAVAETASAQVMTGVWGAVLRDEEGNIDRGCARRSWNLRRYFSHLVGFPELAKLLNTPTRCLDEREIACGGQGLTTVSGALMCISTKIFGDGLCTLLPMYLEDNEICLRSISRGFEVRLLRDLEAVHAGSVSRKSLSQHERALRTMELVESPVQCMVKLQGYSILQLRSTVFFGGVLRMFAAPLVATIRIFRGASFKDEIVWLSNQTRLGSWFAKWAIAGKFHTSPVTLVDYFQEYSPKGTE